MKKIILQIILFAFCISGFSQGKVIEINPDDLKKEEIDIVKQDVDSQNTDSGDIDSDYVKNNKDSEEVSFAIIEHVPLYEGCNENDTNEEKKKCLSNKINKYVATNFNTNISKSLGLADGKQRIQCFFTIDKDGSIINIKTRAAHPALEAEATRVINSIPKLKAPGFQRGKPVKVTFFLPITFTIENDKKPKSKLISTVNVDKFPIHKRCDETLGLNSQKECTTEKISNFIQLGIDLELADRLFPKDKTTQFQVDFIIDKKGKIKNITAKAHHREMAAEAIRVAKRLPRLKAPGYKEGKPVNVPFSILMTIYF